MPYVTEDLWQRLPRRAGDKTESIMISTFPEQVSFELICLAAPDDSCSGVYDKARNHGADLVVSILVARAKLP